MVLGKKGLPQRSPCPRNNQKQHIPGIKVVPLR
jgi:hypothetical protein